jgi:hypothetical protein
MHGFWPFEVTLRSVPKKRVLAIFCSAAAPEIEETAECIERYCDQRTPPDQILLLAPACEDAAIQAIVTSAKFKDRIPAVTRYYNPPASEYLLFDAEGGIVNKNENDVLVGQLSAIKRMALTYLLRNHPVFLTAPQSHHFILPSGKHCQGFFRIGSAMVDGAAIDFMAFCCLPFFPLGIKHIYCDTGTISPVAYAINCLRQRIADNKSCASVGSFGSYKGAKDFRFRDIDNARILISLTSSGGLGPYLCEIDQNIRPESIVTLFTLCDTPGFSNRVCDLRRHKTDNPDGFEAFDGHEEGRCPLCDRGSTRVLISGEQFLPGHARVEPVVVRTKHAPSWLTAFLKRVVGKGLIRANYLSPDARHASKDIFFDMQSLFADDAMLGIDGYKKRMEWMVDQAVPAKVTRIICLDGPGSKAMATVIRDKIRDTLGEKQIYSYSDIVPQIDKYKQNTGATLVVAEAVASGRSLMAVSQLLRYIQPNGAVSYVVGITRLPSPEAFNQIESNLSYGDLPGDHVFVVLDKVSLPLLGLNAQSSWDQELEYLNGLITKCEDTAVLKELEARADIIRACASKAQRGMNEKLFWPKVNGAALTLSPGFVFFADFDKPPAASQADVFFTMLTVLHHLRTLRDSAESLYQHEHLRRVLSPRCFDRFNDGVIQASLLRAALPAELDYSVSEQISGEMAQFLEIVFADEAGQAGEACREFLLALAQGRLRLVATDLGKLKNKCQPQAKDPILKLLWEQILPAEAANQIVAVTPEEATEPAAGTYEI